MDALNEQHVRQAVEVLRQLADEPDEEPAWATAWIGMLSAEPDLAERSGEILRRQLGRAE